MAWRLSGAPPRIGGIAPPNYSQSVRWTPPAALVLFVAALAAIGVAVVAALLMQ
jgi:hypothetical protein